MAPAKKPPRNGVHKRSYERTTPTGRVLKNLQKASRVNRFAIDRMLSWEHSGDNRLLAALSHARNAENSLATSVAAMNDLHKENWMPPPKSTVVTFAEGDEVLIGKKYRPKYLAVYAAAVLDNLVVHKVLETGEIAVRCGGQSPFIVAKSHLDRRRAAKVATKPGKAAEARASK